MNFLAWWHAISLPARGDSSTPMARQRRRYAELTSSFVFFLAICFVPMFPVMFFFSPQSPSSPPAAVLAALTLLVALGAGRFGWQKASAGCVVLYIFDTVLIPILFNPALPLIFTISYGFILAILLGGALISPRVSMIVAIVASVLLVAMVFVEPHPASYMRLIASYNYSVMLILPILMFLLVGISLAIILTQLNKTIRRADRAEEIIVLQTEITKYEAQRKAELDQMESAAPLISEAHRQFANGEVHVRIPAETLAKFDANNALVLAAFSLNSLFGRVQRWREEAMMAQKTEVAVNQMVQELQQQDTTSVSALSVLPLRTGTLIDPLLLELKSSASTASTASTVSRSAR